MSGDAPSSPSKSDDTISPTTALPFFGSSRSTVSTVASSFNQANSGRALGLDEDQIQWMRTGQGRGEPLASTTQAGQEGRFTMTPFLQTADSGTEASYFYGEDNAYPIQNPPSTWDFSLDPRFNPTYSYGTSAEAQQHFSNPHTQVTHDFMAQTQPFLFNASTQQITIPLEADNPSLASGVSTQTSQDLFPDRATTPEGYWRCPCGEFLLTSSKSKNLSRHEKTSDRHLRWQGLDPSKGENGHHCPGCNKRYRRTDSARRHMESCAKFRQLNIPVPSTKVEPSQKKRIRDKASTISKTLKDGLSIGKRKGKGKQSQIRLQTAGEDSLSISSSTGSGQDHSSSHPPLKKRKNDVEEFTASTAASPIESAPSGGENSASFPPGLYYATAPVYSHGSPSSFRLPLPPNTPTTASSSSGSYGNRDATALLLPRTSINQGTAHQSFSSLPVFPATSQHSLPNLSSSSSPWFSSRSVLSLPSSSPFLDSADRHGPPNIIVPREHEYSRGISSDPRSPVTRENMQQEGKDSGSWSPSPSYTPSLSSSIQEPFIPPSPSPTHTNFGYIPPDAVHAFESRSLGAALAHSRGRGVGRGRVYPATVPHTPISRNQMGMGLEGARSALTFPLPSSPLRPSPLSILQTLDSTDEVVSPAVETLEDDSATGPSQYDTSVFALTSVELSFAVRPPATSRADPDPRSPLSTLPGGFPTSWWQKSDGIHGQICCITGGVEGVHSYEAPATHTGSAYSSPESISVPSNSPSPVPVRTQRDGPAADLVFPASGGALVESSGSDHTAVLPPLEFDYLSHLRDIEDSLPAQDQFNMQSTPAISARNYAANFQHGPTDYSSQQRDPHLSTTLIDEHYSHPNLTQADDPSPETQDTADTVDHRYSALFQMDGFSFEGRSSLQQGPH